MTISTTVGITFGRRRLTDKNESFSLEQP